MQAERHCNKVLAAGHGAQWSASPEVGLVLRIAVPTTAVEPLLVER